MQRNALALAAFTDALHHQFLGDRTGQFGAVVAGQHRQQQVEHRHAAAGCEAVAVPVEQMAGGDDLGETLGKVILPAPVHSGAITVEQADLGQRVDAGRQTTDHTPCAHQLLEGGDQWRSDNCWRLVCQQEQFLQAFQLAGPGFARQLPGAVGGGLGEQK
ncbi:hypothetical protein AO262_07825 [Pseudomonas fluorescens ABAC62]|nr:hypothetical protein AO262_07825 [Pseudomonas fluorescens ABAC62]